MQELPRSGPSVLGALVRALRPHQWSKNTLLFLPLLLAHRWSEAATLAQTFRGFVALSLVASALYLVNDLVDLDHDRAHPTKRARPFASGQLRPIHGVVAASLLVLVGAILATTLPIAFAAWLALYAVLSSAYTFRLKRVLMLDVIVLAGLYVLRIAAGGSLAQVVLSAWLLAFAMFFFLGLALVKRTSELVGLTQSGRAPALGRGYTSDDVGVVVGLGTAASAAATVVLALYIESPETLRLYSRPAVLWAACALLLYWQGRLWILAQRGSVSDDPVVFALRDPVSLLCGVGIAVIAALSL